MGTRADFYAGRSEPMEWLGSIAFDGYFDGIPAAVRMATTEEEYRAAVVAFLASSDHNTTPDMGWPWPWDDSQTTDYAYAFDGGTVYGSCFGSAWHSARVPEPEDWPEEKSVAFPDMKSRKNVTYGPRSGLLIIGR